MSRGHWLALALLLSARVAAADVVCRVVGSTGVAFGAYDQVSGMHTDTSLDITVTCDRDGGPQFVSVEMGLGAGLYGASVSARRMRQTGTTEYLNYGLYRDSSRSGTWGSTTGLDTVVKALDIPNKSSVSTTFRVFGRIPANQDPAAGMYGDSVQVTVQP